ncbi:TIGR00730 family Rossman fold protein [Candidatus Paracaedibacter symbiosus]|uniref:LOG family protein n=1 Tax=Candidatus Paracaedibacter symbiosus TaxID=244582 RepID=UPI0005095E26|nr:TIGR00730 family Rossman fold protein [Candidatus Paracaedibacter symbiosus]
MGNIQSVCVYCGASVRADQIYKDAAVRMGEVLAKAGLQVIFGGGKLGLMGLVADNAMANGARVIGIIPKLLENFEGAHPSLSELHIVDTMHTRKKKMSELADAFIVLPGGFGTLDELFEILTWRQLQMHDKPVIIVNVNGYWDPLRKLIHNIIEQNFAPTGHALFATFVDSPDEVLDILENGIESRLKEPSVG